MADLLVLARLSAMLVAGLVLVWAVAFRASFLPLSSSSSSSSSAAAAAAASISHLDHLYSALHPLLMVIGFILLSGEAILVHRWMSGWSRGARKAVHLWLQGAALGFGVFGIWAKFRGRDGILSNFYSLHSWMGLLCVSLFAAQWVVGFMSFWHRGEKRWTRAVVLPWHVFVGLYTYSLAVVTAEMGLLEKLTFLQAKHGLPRYSHESTLVNVLGLGLALLCGLVVFAAVSAKQNHYCNNNNNNNNNNYYYYYTSRHKANHNCIISHQSPSCMPSDNINGRWIHS